MESRGETVKKAQGKQILGNTAYTMGGMLLMNGVLQLAVYPLLNARMGRKSWAVCFTSWGWSVFCVLLWDRR